MDHFENEGTQQTDILVAQPLQEIDFTSVEEALAPFCEEQEALPHIFAALPDKPY